MPKPKQLFKSEAKHIRKLLDVLCYNAKLSGTRVVLGEVNQALLNEAIRELQNAELLLLKID